MSKKAAVILSGCGYKEGSEIHETVLSYLAMAEKGIEYNSYAPEKQIQASAPIARDQLSPLSGLQEESYDILWLPGGMGVAKNLSNYADEGPNCSVDADVRRAIEAFRKAKKPIVAICFAPVIVAKVLEGQGLKMTVGSKEENFHFIQDLGMNPVSCKASDFCVDQNIYTSPGYMDPPNIAGIYASLKKIVESILSIPSSEGV